MRQNGSATFIHQAPSQLPAMNDSKLAILLYGLVAYVMFLAVFAYTAGWLLGIGVPKTIDAVVDEPSSIAVAIVVNASILGLFAVQHMIMARGWFKKRWTKIIPAAAERSTFVLATNLLLVLLFWQWRPMTGILWEVGNPVARGVLYGLSAAGFLGVVFSTFLIDHFDLFGLKQVVLNFRGRPQATPVFQVNSLYRFTRHPLYLSFFAAFWCAPTMTVGHLLFAGLCTGFVLVAVRFEERDLITEHGEDYERYRRSVPMILPNFVRTAAPTKGSVSQA